MNSIVCRAGIESDLTAVRLAEDYYRLYVGSGSIRRILVRPKRRSGSFAVEIDDVSEAIAVIGLKGPEETVIAKAIGANDLLGLGYFAAGQTEIAFVLVLVLVRHTIDGFSGSRSGWPQAVSRRERLNEGLH